MRKVIALLVLIVAVGFLGGCGETLHETAAQRNRRIARQRSIEWKLMVEDIDRLLLIDHASRLTPDNM